MLNFKILTTALMLMATICFTSCDDADNKPATCDPATCEMAMNATEMMCNEADQCVVKTCAESYKVAEDAKSCEAETSATCDPACEEGKTECKCENDTCTCIPVTPPANECEGKSVGDECAEGKTCQDENGTLACKDKPAPTTCEPACTEGKECKCEADKCECVDKQTSVPTCEPMCDTEKQDCICEANKCECKDKTATEPADPCKDKAENTECGENKTCQKGEGDKLECKDKPMDQTPAEPAQPE